MASLDHYFATRQCVWGEFSPSGNPFLAVSEIWHAEGSSAQHKAIHRTINNGSLSKWFIDTNSSSPMDKTFSDHTCILRVTWVPHDRKNGVNDVGAGILEELTSEFHHDLAQMRFRSSFAGIDLITETLTGKQTYYFCNHPHLAVTWSQCAMTGLTSVICIAQPKKIAVLQDVLSCQFIQTLAGLELVPALMCSILCCQDIDRLFTIVKPKVQSTEVRTGHHAFVTRGEAPAIGDLVQLSGEMSGCVSKIAVITRKLGVLGELNSFTIERARRSKSGEKVDERRACAELISDIEAIQRHCDMQRLDADFFKSRAHIQSEALVHLIAEHDVLANQELAKNTHCLAILARKDAASIKALTIVATFFIPPTFISSLFSIPLFDWDSAGSEHCTGGKMPWMKRLFLYLTVTGPLMLLLILTWGIIILLQRHKHRNKAMQSKLSKQSSSSQGSEVMSLLSQRLSKSSASGDAEDLLGRLSTR